jgi:leucyl/phenylalanyl-tRNA--protein transferase
MQATNWSVASTASASARPSSARACSIALVHLVARLQLGGFRLLDAQFITPHLAALGAVEIPRDEYRRLLSAAVDAPADFAAWAPGEPMPGEQALELALATP